VLAPTTVTITRVNDAPTFGNFADGVAVTNEDTEVEISLAVLLGFGDESDVDGTVDGFVVKSIASGTLRIGPDAASATAWALGSNDLIDAGNKAYWTPATHENGLQSAFVAAAVDDAGVESTGTAIAMVSVLPINDAPSFTSTAPTSATEELAYSYSITTSDVDSGDNLTLTAPTLPAWLTLVDNGDGTATLSGTPDDPDVGNHNVVLRVNDGTADVDQSFTITVDAVNDLPVLGNHSLTLNQGETVRLTLADLSATDVDNNDGDLIFQVKNVHGGYFALASDPGRAIKEFTQDQVAAGEVVFVDDGDGKAPRFKVEVHDGVDSTDETDVTVGFTLRPIEPPTPSVEPEPELEVIEEKPVTEIGPEVEEKAVATEAVPLSTGISDPAPVTERSSGTVDDGGEDSRSAAEEDRYRPERRLQGIAQAVSSALRTDWFKPGEYLIETLQRTEQFKQFEQLLASSDFRDNLDRVRNGFEDLRFQDHAVMGSTAAVSTGLSVGYVAWLLRGGVLLSTVLSSMPAWNLVDPLPILASTKAPGRDEDDDSLEDIIKKPGDAADDKARTPDEE
jgi:hypothetical protein